MLGDEILKFFNFPEDRISMFGKPSALRRLIRKSRIKTSEILSTEDEIRDLDAAHKVKIPFGAVTWGYATREALEERSPRFTFANMYQIIEVIDSQA